ncbi:hypothetical protein [Streptomyces sp. SCSIO ZS0520]|uniref:hypothetical protein n=1 Tax=Streptomyces sp. SCSIO ZS0520 TaxID=2892996 RepID=UPI0021DA6C85|nr:hypothetical protein [Streptomyces sp. SCSIO ZS0520]
MSTRVLPRLRTTAAATLAGVLGALLAGCGIRPTEVPTDYGAAPSRASCTLSAPETGARSAEDGIPVQIFLVCASQLVLADRSAQLPERPASADRLRVARALLDQLERLPSATERQVGYTTDIRRLTVRGPRSGDPTDTLRLSTAPEDLSAFALAQLVCTYANSAAADDRGGVTLGGPEAEPLRRYECPAEVRSRPSTEAPPNTVVERD